MARFVFMGSPTFAVASFRALADAQHLGDIACVVTQPDKPAGRGRKLTPCAVKVEAQERGYEVFSPRKMKALETREKLASFEPDVAVVAAYGRILPKALLEIPRLGCINVHASVLPRWRGASPIAHAILSGDAETGVSIMQMDEGMDTGPVFRSVSTPIGEDETCAGLTERLAQLGAKTLLEVLPEILSGRLAATPQEDALATHASLLDKNDGVLDLTQSADELSRRIRAMHPWPGAFVFKEKNKIGILGAQVCPDVVGTPGTVLRADAKGVQVACGTGGLDLLEVKPAGRKQMPATAWAAGRGIAQGDQLLSSPCD